MTAQAQTTEVKYAATAVTNTTPNSCVDVLCYPKVRVTYEFKTAGVNGGDKSRSLKGLAYLPVVISNGKYLALPGCETPERLGITHKIVFDVDMGDTVGLFLGSDAKAGYRNQCLYQVTTIDRDVHVTIQEKFGKHKDADTPKLASKDKTTERYTAPLTGDIWMKCSHIYTADEVDGLIGEAIPASAREGLRHIYSGTLMGPPYRLQIPIDNARCIKLMWQEAATGNAKRNITWFDERTEILPRVHPAAYASLIKAAIEADVDELEISSGWRPMLGSSGHRMGIGLDVVAIKRAGQRSELRRVARPAEKDAKKAIVVAKEALNKAKESGDRQKIADAQHKMAEAQAAYFEEVRHAESFDALRYRNELLKLDAVRQIFDPWLMEDATKDANPPALNRLESKNEILHRTHLHITINDPPLGYERAAAKPAQTPKKNK